MLVFNVAWLQVSDVMLRLAKNIYLIGKNEFTCVSLVNDHAWVQRPAAPDHYACTNTQSYTSVLQLPRYIIDNLLTQTCPTR